LLEDELDCDFYFGDSTYSKIKKMDYSRLKKKVLELPFRLLKSPFYYLKGEVGLSNKPYTHYIITGQPYSLSSWLLITLNRFRGKKTFIWNHGLYGKENGFQLFMKKLQTKLIDGYFLYGNYAKNLMQKEGIPIWKLHVVFNSLDHSKQLEIRKTLKKSNIIFDYFNNTNPTLVFIGRITAVKKLDLLFLAIDRLRSKGKYYNLILIGDGPEKDKLLHRMLNLNLQDQIWFYGACYDESKLGELIFNADLCVSPGNVGLTAVHSMGYGTPVITHNNFANQMPEFEAIIQGETGDFFEENNLDNLVKTIENWIEKYPKKSNNLIEQCYKRIDDF